MIERGRELMLLPDPGTPLATGDTLLMCARANALRRILWTINNLDVSRYVMAGERRPNGLRWRWLARRRLNARGFHLPR